MMWTLFYVLVSLTFGVVCFELGRLTEKERKDRQS
jgi:hypothetical protein